MMPHQKQALTAVFFALGPERVARGMKAPGAQNWRDCFLGWALGDVRNFDDAWTRLSVPPYQLEELVFLWDSGHREEVLSLASEWLEERASAKQELTAAILA